MLQQPQLKLPQLLRHPSEVDTSHLLCVKLVVPLVADGVSVKVVAVTPVEEKRLLPAVDLRLLVVVAALAAMIGEVLPPQVVVMFLQAVVVSSPKGSGSLHHLQRLDQATASIGQVLSSVVRCRV